MRTLLTGEFATATNWSSDVYPKFEVQNASGTWIDVGAALGRCWMVNARWSETIDQPVSGLTITLVPIVAGVSMSPLMAASSLNVDDSSAYAPLLEIGRLMRLSVATMPQGVALDVTKYRRIFDGRIDDLEEADSNDGQQPITVACSDLGAWLTDIEIESTTNIQYGTDTPPGTALETVLQSILDDNIPSGEPAVTLYKQSSSTFAVTPKYTQQQDKLLPPLVAIVLDTAGEDLRYRYDASHVSRLTWFNPDRSRTSVDATFDVNGYAVQKLDRSIANIRNAGRIPSPGTIGTYVANTSTAVTIASIASYRRRFMQLPASVQLTTDAQALSVLDAAINDLAGAPIDASFVLPFAWFVQLFDRYTFPANGRQYDSDQTLAVVGYEHVLSSGKGRTTLLLTGRVVGAYAAWRKRIALGGPATNAPSVTLSVDSAGTTSAVVSINGTLGDGATGRLEWAYRTWGDAGTPSVYSTWNTTDDLPQSITVAYLNLNHVMVQARVRQTGDGQIVESAVLSLRGVMPAQDPTTGRVKRAVPLDDGDYAVKATDSLGEAMHANVAVSVGTKANLLLAKPLAGDPNTIDSAPDGVTYARPLVSRINAGRPVIDFAEAIHSNQTLDHVSDGTRKAVTAVDGSGKALIDFTQAHTGKTLANLADDPTSGRFAGAQAGANSGGTQIRSNPDFTGGSVAGWNVYDNNATGNVTITPGTAPGPNSSGWIITIHVAAGASPAPGLGGFFWGLSPDTGAWAPDTYHKGGRNLARIMARIPIGLSLNFATNAIGTGGAFTWLTPVAGTGDWYEYVGQLVIGASGTFSTTGFFYLTGSVAAPFDWFAASGTLTAISQPAGVINFGANGHAAKHMDSIPDGPSGTRSAIHGAYVDASNRPVTLRDPFVGADVAVVDVNEAKGRALAGLASSGDVNRDVPLARAVANVSGISSADGKLDPGVALHGTTGTPVHTQHNVSALANGATVEDGSTRARSALDTNNRLVNQSHGLMLQAAGVSALQTSSSLLTCTGTSGNWTISIAAHAVQFGFGQVSYAAGSIHVTFNATQFFVYVTDPTFAGGTVTYLAVEIVSSLDVASNSGNYYVGAITTPASSGSSSGSTGGSGSSGDYVGPTT